MGEREWVVEYSTKSTAGEGRDSSARIKAPTIGMASRYVEENVIPTRIWFCSSSPTLRIRRLPRCGSGTSGLPSASRCFERRNHEAG